MRSRTIPQRELRDDVAARAEAGTGRALASARDEGRGLARRLGLVVHRPGA